MASTAATNTAYTVVYNQSSALNWVEATGQTFTLTTPGLYKWIRIVGLTIGANSAGGASLQFTFSLKASNPYVNLTNTLDASSSLTGALRIAGGVGIMKSLYVGGSIYSGGSQLVTQTSLASTLASSTYDKPTIDQKISNAVTSGTVDLSNYVTQSSLTTSLNAKMNTFTVATGLSLAGNVLSVDMTSLYTKGQTDSAISNALAAYQTVTTADSKYATISALNLKQDNLTFSAPMNLANGAVSIDLSPYQETADADSKYATIASLGSLQNTLSVTSPLTLTGSTLGLNLSSFPSLVISDTTDSSALGTGSLQTAGGLSVAKTMYVGQDIKLSTTAATGLYWGTSGAALGRAIQTGHFVGNAQAGDLVIRTSGNNIRLATNTGTSALDILQSGIVVNNSTEATSPSSAAFQVSGGVSVGKSLLVRGGTVNLVNNTSNMLVFNNSGSGLPTLGSRSAGSKIVLQPVISGSGLDTAIGVQTIGLWFSVPTTTGSYGFRWYSGNSPSVLTAMELTGSGQLLVNGYHSATSVNLGALQVKGGCAVGENLFVGNTLSVLSTTDASGTTPALTCSGGGTFAKSLNVGAWVTCNTLNGQTVQTPSMISTPTLTTYTRRVVLNDSTPITYATIPNSLRDSTGGSLEVNGSAVFHSPVLISGRTQTPYTSAAQAGDFMYYGYNGYGKSTDSRNYALMVGGRVLMEASTEIDVYSDAAVKRVIRTFDEEEALNIVSSTRSVKFRYINSQEDRDSYGFIAQEVLDKVPDLISVVSHDGTERYVFRESGMLPVLWAAVRKLTDQVQTLMDEVAEMRKRAKK